MMRRRRYYAFMRTTVTLDDDLVAALREQAGRTGTSFKDAVNAAVRRGLRQREPDPNYRLPSRPMGLHAEVHLDRALRLAAADQDDETLRKLALRK